jgi:CheY-like chemotaxis protein
MASKPRILVVEDEVGVRDLIRTRLSLAGYDVHTARSGLEALGRLTEIKPDALVLDLNLPELDGLAVLEFIQRMPAAGRVPTLVVSARHSPDDVRKAVESGAKDYLSKPFTEAQLLHRVARLLLWTSRKVAGSGAVII